MKSMKTDRVGNRLSFGLHLASRVENGSDGFKDKGASSFFG